MFSQLSHPLYHLLTFLSDHLYLVATCESPACRLLTTRVRWKVERLAGKHLLLKLVGPTVTWPLNLNVQNKQKMQPHVQIAPSTALCVGMYFRWDVFLEMRPLCLNSCLGVSGCLLASSARLPVEQMNRGEVSSLSVGKPISHMRRDAQRQPRQIYLLSTCRCILAPLPLSVSA